MITNKCPECGHKIKYLSILKLLIFGKNYSCVCKNCHCSITVSGGIYIGIMFIIGLLLGHALSERIIYVFGMTNIYLELLFFLLDLLIMMFVIIVLFSLRCNRL